MGADAFPVKPDQRSRPFLDRSEIFSPPLGLGSEKISSLCMSHAGIVKQAYVINLQI